MTDNVVIQPVGRRRKHAAGKSGSPVESRLGWADVLGVLPGEEARSVALGAYRAQGWTPEDFDRDRTARAAMADALARAEDLVEGQHVSARRDAELAGLRTVRRRLELELWP